MDKYWIVAMRFSKIRRGWRPGFTTEYIPLIKGDDSGGDTPLPLPNREVKPASADGTARETLWESRSSPIFLLAGQPVSLSTVSFVAGAGGAGFFLLGFCSGRDGRVLLYGEALGTERSGRGGEGRCGGGRGGAERE